MAIWQAVLLGVMTALTPGLVVLLWMLRSLTMPDDPPENTSVALPDSRTRGPITMHFGGEGGANRSPVHVDVQSARGLRRTISFGADARPPAPEDDPGLAGFFSSEMSSIPFNFSDEEQIDREYPHQVEIAIPAGGLGDKQTVMRTFCRERGIQFATCGIEELGRECGANAVRYCFRVADDAEEFQAMYGGERVVVPAERPPTPSIGRRVAPITRQIG